MACRLFGTKPLSKAMWSFINHLRRSTPYQKRNRKRFVAKTALKCIVCNFPQFWPGRILIKQRESMLRPWKIAVQGYLATIKANLMRKNKANRNNVLMYFDICVYICIERERVNRQWQKRFHCAKVIYQLLLKNRFRKNGLTNRR